ncbi:NAD(P)-binding protein [Nannocystis bainbridge]|uniref:NAD(P)-binding protein n=1 Tax=Nannocystis bainbridge TaxID=2995303 RepID=A0ABT5DZX1_9BACT|nr:NAD(P)-binding protein [Nannocystis bainbridge]MDC0719153.1 NAD(P)-binding protein [Nannocystis bainbridge]
MQDLSRARELAIALSRNSGGTDAHARAAALSGELASLFNHPTGAPGTLSGYQAEGTLDARVAVLVLPAATVRRLLPAGLELAPQPVVPAEYHPVYLFFSHENFPAWFGTMDYHELLIGVPWVQIADPKATYPGPFVYMPRLYLNELAPCELGVHMYGWEKQMGTLDVVGDGAPTVRFTVTPKDGSSPAAIGEFTEIPGVGPKSSADFKNFLIVRQLFEQPTISQALHIVDRNSFDSKIAGPFLAANNTLEADKAGATIQPLAATITIGASLTPPGIPPGTYHVPSLLDAELGAFRIRCPQAISLPGSCADASYPRPPAARKLRVAVFGGGPSACVAALYLARQTDRYQVTLYTTGYRLGGKCQSWRNPDKAWRVEEHGLHAFLGFYHNAFTAVQDAYHDGFASPEVGEALYQNAFYAEHHNGLMVHHRGEWSYCPLPSPSAVAPTPSPTASSTGGHALLMAVEALARRALEHFSAMADAHAGLADGMDAHASVLQRLRSAIVGLVVRAAEDIYEADLGGIDDFIAAEVEKVRDNLANRVRATPSLPTYLWFLWTGADTMLTIAVGLLKNPVKNLSELDGSDFRDWLKANGLHEAAGESWAVIDQVYETLFSHQDADPAKDACKLLDTAVRPANLAAGVATRWFLLESLGYRGAPAYRFEYSCAQTMMTPYYLALQRLGAEVRFFHTVTGLELAGSGEQRELVRVHLQRQAEVKGGPAAYQPLVIPDLANNPPELHDWPLDPDWSQLVDGDWYREHNIDFYDSWQAGRNTRATPVQLERGEGFDLCVLGVPLGALPLIDSPLTRPTRSDADPAWKRMIDGIAVTQTMSFQLWLKPNAGALIAGAPRGLLTCFAQPEPSYGDFTPLIAHEEWQAPGPHLLSYFTGASVAGKPPLPPECGPEYPRRIQAQWVAKVTQWLGDHYAEFYDGSSTPDSFGGFLDDLVVEGEPLIGAARLEWQHLIADVEPSNLYVLSQPGSIGLRLGQAESGVKGLLLCGDWTRTDLNCGCVEAATASGMLAARAISNEPRTVWRPGF